MTDIVSDKKHWVKYTQLDIDLLHIIGVKTHGFHHWNNLKQLSVLWGILLSAPLVVSENKRGKNRAKNTLEHIQS